ncbi:MAG: hypothetical protein V4670_11010 [Bacteroidota bacterium]
MKSTLLTLFSVIVMLTSCKCKKATSDVVELSENKEEVSQIPNKEMSTNPVEPSKNISESGEVMLDASKEVQETAPIVEYEANTRGYFMKLKYANNQLGFTKERDNDKLTLVTLTKAQQEEINTMLASTKVESLPELKDPTQKRFYDGAAIAHLKVVKAGKEYNTVDFDHGFPPAEIEKLVKKLVSYTEQK